MDNVDREELSGRLRLKWSVLGNLTLDLNGKLKFPMATGAPGLYKLSITQIDETKGIYFGESDNLARRFSHYRNPGPIQQTNIRMNKLLIGCLSKLGAVTVSALTTDAWIDDCKADLASKLTRRLFEHFAIARHTEAAIELHNL